MVEGTAAEMDRLFHIFVSGWGQKVDLFFPDLYFKTSTSSWEQHVLTNVSAPRTLMNLSEVTIVEVASSAPNTCRVQWVQQSTSHALMII